MSDNKFKVIEGGAGKTPGLTILLTEKERKFLLDECIIDDPDIIEAIETAPLNGKNYTLTLPDEDMEHLDGCVSFVYGEYAAESHGGNSVDECGMNNKLNSTCRNSGRKSAEVYNHEKSKKKLKICEGILDKTDPAVYGEDSIYGDELIRKELLRQQLIEVINTQISENNPPETKLTYDRLMKQFKDHDEVMRHIGCVIVAEIFDVLKKKEPYNKERYVEKLNNLPDLSWMNE